MREKEREREREWERASFGDVAPSRISGIATTSSLLCLDDAIKKKEESARIVMRDRRGTGKRRADTPTRKPSKFPLWFRAYGARFVFLAALPLPLVHALSLSLSLPLLSCTPAWACHIRTFAIVRPRPMDSIERVRCRGRPQRAA